MLVFNKFVPEMTASQVRSLIVPMIDFSLKTPAEAFADTLPPKLKGAVLNHEVLVGMNREMVLKAVRPARPKGSRNRWADSVRGMDLRASSAPGPVCPLQWQSRHSFGDCRCRPATVIRDKDETDGYFAGQFVRQVRLGDAPPAAPSGEHAPAAAPTLRQPGEQLPDAVNKDQQMKPVQFPDDEKPKPIPPPPQGLRAAASIPIDQCVGHTRGELANCRAGVKYR